MIQHILQADASMLMEEGYSMIKDELELFKFQGDKWVTAGDIRKALLDTEANQCRVLFVHSDLSFGVKNSQLNRAELCEILYGLIEETHVETIVFPTFTFSFCNYEDFDVCNSPSKMGMLSEYVRKKVEAKRSLDSIMSVVVLGDTKGLLDIRGKKALGEGSVFDILHNTEGVRFLFFGTRFGLCGTHMHYVEEKLRVPYRYDMEFSGRIIDENGVTYNDSRIIFVKYQDVIPCVPTSFEDMLLNKGYMKYAPVGDNGIYSILETDMYREVYNALSNDVNAFLGEPYDTHPLVKNYQFGHVTTVQ